MRSLARVPAVVLPVMILIAASGCGSGGVGDELNGMTRTPPTEVGRVALPDESPGGGGRQTRLRGEEDGLMLVYFGYTFCPDVCPTTLADLGVALGELPEEQARRVKVGMVTVDPERDTPKALNGYLGHFFAPGRFASFRTTDDDELARAESAFGASSKLGKADRHGNYEVAHTAQVFAVDGTGQVLVEWPFGTPSEDIRSDLERLLGDGGIGSA
ncbi:MAG: electron transporter SenC [Actinomycetes bacterium]|nr:MAG: electron transporter SenC [Actinomycetes bacterium]